ncbi:MAG TPA: hypothetical protein VL547_13660 [Dinghuibacter sp.]|uniref:hypothetical protein n=1 Tax=Dinghuibacter sp. TaxID=2024697 RepID=UPI002B7DE71D|nr:hypothetical protein [Dinghuibacter sp.]HTJ13074.1 hypothetical protein [Dinghuibacter sp.]
MGVKDKKTGNLPWIAAALALTAVALALWALPGVGISADAITYASVSRNLTQGGVLRSFDRDMYVDFPVGYPFFLGVIQWVTRVDPLAFGQVVNAILFGLLVAGVIGMLEREGVTKWQRTLIGACVAASPALLQVYEMLWSETLFIFCIGVFLWAGAWYGRTHSWRAFWLMVAAAGVAAVTRYAGVTVIATGGLVLLLEHKRIGRAFLFGTVASAPLAINLVRNRLIGGTVTGDRQKNLLPLSVHLNRFGGVLCEWTPPLDRAKWLYTAVAILFLLVIVVAWWRSRKRPAGLFAIALTLAAVYSAFILTTAMLTAFEALDTRLLAPLVVPALIGLGNTLPKKTVILALLIISSVAADIRYIKDPGIAYKSYVRYDPAALDRSPTITFVNRQPVLLDSNTSVYTNAPDILYWKTRRVSSDYLPSLDDPEDLRDFRYDHGAYLIWIDACLAYPKAYLDRLKQQVSLELVYTFPDGAIYIYK